MNKQIKEINKKRAQVTIFVIIALVIIVIIALVFFIINKPEKGIPTYEDPQAYIEKCMDDYLVRVEKKLFDTNLFTNMTDNYIMYMDKKVKYLCKSSTFYMPCVNQEPMLAETIRLNIEREAKPEAEKCFSELIKILRNKGYNINETKLNIRIDFFDKVIEANMDKKLTMNNGENSRIFNSFRAELQTPLYNIIDTIRNIVNYESTLCEFNSMNWMKNYPNIEIKRFVTSDQTKVYSVIDKASQKQISFAVKTCDLPAGT